MTALTSPLPRVDARLEDGRGQSPAASCDVCPHPAAAHDRIGQRFCDATLTGAMTRGCVCRAS